MKRRLVIILPAVFALTLCLLGCRAAETTSSTLSGMDQYTKDLIDSIAKVAGLITVIAGVIGVVIQVSKNRGEQRSQETQRAFEAEKLLQERVKADALRREELRWRKAGLARDVINEFLSDPNALSAMQMLDWSGRTYTYEGVNFTVSTKDMHHALRITNLEFDKKEAFVRACFDALFGHMQLTEHFIRIGLLELEDVRYPHAYFAELMANNRNVFETYLTGYKYDLALAFLRHFPKWEN